MIEELPLAGLPPVADVLVLTVSERWLPPPAVYEFATADRPVGGPDGAREVAEAAAKHVRHGFPSWKVRAEGAVGSPAREILDRAAQWRASLIVLGSLGHSALARVIIGSVSFKVANEAPCSVRVVRPGLPRSGVVLAAYDALPAARRVLGVVAARSAQRPFQVRLVFAVGSGPPPAGELTLPADAVAAAATLDDARRVLVASGIVVEPVLREGDPKHVLLEEAAYCGAECIFLGANSHTFLDRLLLGTVSGALLARATCSVEIVR
jgi:nucleotide-binding universal stress UspA family protein